VSNYIGVAGKCRENFIWEQQREDFYVACIHVNKDRSFLENVGRKEKIKYSSGL
jgi:hypothetical protein